jgi:hypothetical protein
MANRSFESSAAVRRIAQSLAVGVIVGGLLLPASSVPADLGTADAGREHLQLLLTRHALRYAIHAATPQVQECMDSEPERAR